jgi:ribosomal protein S27E
MTMNPISDAAVESGVLTAKCPACGQRTRVHKESVRVGAEVLCIECSAILRIDAVKPLTFSEVEESDLI